MGNTERATARILPRPGFPVHSAEPWRPIEDYALIGDCRTAALVSSDGSLDWLCLPEFAGPSVFGALLDRQRGGRFRIRPTGAFEAEQRYVPHTNVLETTFRTEGGVCVLRDLMPVRSEREKRAELFAEHEILRELECLSGSVELEIHYEPRPDYGRNAASLRERGALGVWCDVDAGALFLIADVPLVVGQHAATGRCILEAGERRHFSLNFSEQAPAVIPLLGEHAVARRERTEDWWQAWAARCTYEGPYRESVVRSALALKLMAYAPSGALIAAPTTSLPESIGAAANWDYRYCWLRDASLTIQALLGVGYYEEATAFLDWMLHATRKTLPQMRVMYSLFGNDVPAERELDHLEGYRGSQPVRVGNGARHQFQLDIYGEVVRAIARATHPYQRLSNEMKVVLRGIGDTVCRQWRQPDAGIWEQRSGEFHYTHSKILSWVALDQLIQLHERGRLDVPVAWYRHERDAIREEIEARAFNEELGSYVSTFGGDDVDASLLVAPLHGYVKADDPRMLATVELVYQRLGTGPLLHRFAFSPEGAAREGAFGICSFWGVDVLARAGQVERADEAFRALLGYASPTGLFAEEIDPETGAHLGNYPQAFTHIGLINAALALRAHGDHRVSAQAERIEA